MKLLIFTSLLVELLLYPSVNVTVTAYSPKVNQTDFTPYITASNKRVSVGYVALSRDLEKRYCLKFGGTIFLKGLGFFEFQDRMNRRKKNWVDIFYFSTKKAKKFGIKKNVNLIILKKE